MTTVMTRTKALILSLFLVLAFAVTLVNPTPADASVTQVVKAYNAWLVDCYVDGGYYYDYYYNGYYYWNWC